ncbi:response regulator transcription factor [Burkholderia gladioli]|uniref:response regulator transcription factor n=1 Tax=Burkholderia gladioli TaxID=28095 RepID=UPI0024457915|nr:response regulator transcription factor [Burkholderia gladioli]
MAPSSLDVVLADHQPTMLAGLATVLREIDGLRIAGSAQSPPDLMDVLSRVPCRLLVTDYSLPDAHSSDGLSMLARIRNRHAGLRIVVFTSQINARFVDQMRRIGIPAIVSKSDSLDHLVAAIQAVLAGGNYHSPAIPLAQAEDMRLGRGVTRSELEVLHLYLSGLSITEIATRRNRSKQTVSAQRLRGMRKLGIERNADLFRMLHEDCDSLLGSLHGSMPQKKQYSTGTTASTLIQVSDSSSCKGGV